MEEEQNKMENMEGSKPEILPLSPAGPGPGTAIKHNKGEKGGFSIVGINLLVFAVYTIICLAVGRKDGGFFAFLMAGFHAFITVVLAIVFRRWVWLLSGLLLLVIGFATCVSTVSLDIH